MLDGIRVPVGSGARWDRMLKKSGNGFVQAVVSSRAQPNKKRVANPARQKRRGKQCKNA